jgi:hypothetical protein
VSKKEDPWTAEIPHLQKRIGEQLNDRQTVKPNLIFNTITWDLLMAVQILNSTHLYTSTIFPNPYHTRTTTKQQSDRSNSTSMRAVVQSKM